MDLIIRGGRVVTAEESFEADIAIEKGMISAIGPSIDAPAYEVIDARGMIILPGVIDAHVHFQLPMGGTASSDDFENGTRAAACGGVTTVIDFATQRKGESLQETVAKRRAEADGRVAVDYSLHVSPTVWEPGTIKEMTRLMDDGYTSFKLYMTYARQGLMSDDEAIFSALELTANKGGIVTVHAESDSILGHFIARYHNKQGYAEVRSILPCLIEAECG